MLEALAWSTYLDKRNIADKPNMTVQRTPNTAALIALQVTHATRIEEAAFMRRRYIDSKTGASYIAGTKTRNAKRLMLHFESTRAQLDQILAVAPPEPDAFDFRVDPRDTRRREDGTEIAPSRTTLGQRISHVLECAGLKYPRQNTHIFRDTPITWLKAEGLDETTIKVLVGHKALSGITAEYLNAELFVRMLTDLNPDIRGHLRSVPTTEAVAARAIELEEAEAFERWQRGQLTTAR